VVVVMVVMYKWQGRELELEELGDDEGCLLTLSGLFEGPSTLIAIILAASFQVLALIVDNIINLGGRLRIQLSIPRWSNPSQVCKLGPLLSSRRSQSHDVSREMIGKTR
jgi:hypothetical protein